MKFFLLKVVISDTGGIKVTNKVHKYNTGVSDSCSMISFGDILNLYK